MSVFGRWGLAVHARLPIMNAAMEKTSREKIALIVFLILAIGMGCILFGYVFAGHSWNVTASNIDDAFGNMEGYTAIVYEGTIEEEESAAQSSASATSAANGSANSKNAGDAESLPGDSKAGDGQASASSSSSSDGNQASASSSENSQASSAASSSDKQTVSSQGGSSVNTASPTSVSAQGNGSVDQGVSTASEPVAAKGSASEGTVGQGVSAAVSPGAPEFQANSAAPLAGHKKEKEPIALSDVDALYRGKGANVISLHTNDLSTYEEGTILKRGGKRYGIFSVTREYSRILIDEKVKYFTDQKVDYVIALCPEESYLKNAENIDIVITTADSTISSMGESRNGAFYVSTPKIGSVGAILISPSNVVSAKTISEL